MEMVGFRYDPTDEELMKILMKKVDDAEQSHLNHHFDFIVNDCEVYGKIPPWEIYDSHTHYHLHTFHRKLYVFTDLKTTTGNRVCRAAACGTWLEKSKPKRIYDSQGNVIGIDRMLSFKAKDLHSGKLNKTNWIMHEFSLANQEFGRSNTVLCVIYKLNKGSGSDCEEANGRGLKRAFSSTTAGEEFSCFNTNAAAVISLEPEPEPVMPSADDEEFAAWVSGCFSSTAAVAEEASAFNTTGVMSHGQEDAQAQEHKKRRLDTDTFTDEEFAAWITDPTFPDEPLSQIFSDLPLLVEGIMVYGFVPIWLAMGYASPCSGLAGWLDRSACCELRNINEGRKVHCEIVKVGSLDSIVLTALVDMYAICGEVGSYCEVFDEILDRNVVSWTSMIVGYVQNDCLEEGLVLFNRFRP
uniref:NAC domain-containing protein n=1 Tax=Quercus lobata TaxID=97700 RepID=A0A7N2LHL7_QUELO